MILVVMIDIHIHVIQMIGLIGRKIDYKKKFVNCIIVI
jgi:hypothetical protein